LKSLPSVSRRYAIAPIAHALRVALEFLPWTAIPDAGIAWEIVELAGRANGGVLVDSWHYFRGGGGPGTVTDDPAQSHRGDPGSTTPRSMAGGDLLEDTMKRRLPRAGRVRSRRLHPAAGQHRRDGADFGGNYLAGTSGAPGERGGQNGI